MSTMSLDFPTTCRVTIWDTWYIIYHSTNSRTRYVAICDFGGILVAHDHDGILPLLDNTEQWWVWDIFFNIIIVI